MLVIDSLQEIVNEIEEICVVYTLKDGTRRIVHSAINDPLAFYGVIIGLAHNILLHGDGDPLDES
jgi:hypothetical protein